MILAIDPGSEKTGVALVRDDGSLEEKQIIPTASLATYLTAAHKTHAFTDIVMGDGTNHKHLQPVAEQWIAAEQTAQTIGFHLVDERFTTVEGRKLYFKYTRLHGWRRWVPTAWQYPPEPVDDFVAWIIGRRFLQQKGGLA